MTNSTETPLISLDDLTDLCTQLLIRHGASPDHAAATGRSAVIAEAEGNRGVGVAHLFSYCDALDAGRADGTAEPEITRPTPTLTRIDAREGFPHLGVDRASSKFTEAAKEFGISMIALRNGYSCGALGYFVGRLADNHGLAAIAAANAGPAVMPASGGKRPVFCTNPLAFAMPVADGPSIVIDQSSSASAMVGIRQAAARGETIPEGWALDKNGTPTTDPNAALEGTLLPFGGARGANIALMVEMLAAGLTGANWSMDAPAFNAGNRSPGAGLTIIAIDPGKTGGSAGYMARFMDVVGTEPGVHIPGIRKTETRAAAERDGMAVETALYRRLIAAAEG